MRKKSFGLILALAIIILACHPVLAMNVFGNTNLTNYISIYEDSDIMLINGKEHSMEASTYYSEDNASLMVPVRFICMGLGVDEAYIKWDSLNSAVTVDIGKRIILFQVGGSYYYIDGMPIPILTADAESAVVEIKDGRAYVPYNTIGEALNVLVEWDAGNASATYNAPQKM